MPKKQKWIHRTTPWLPLQRATLPDTEVQHAAALVGADNPAIAQMLEGEFWLNDRYQVHKRLLDQGPDACPWVWLSMHRLDRAPARDSSRHLGLSHGLTTYDQGGALLA